MKLFLLLIVLAGFISCKKDKPQAPDYRDAVVGEYTGIRVITTLPDTTGLVSDTTLATVFLTKSTVDTMVIIRFDPDTYGEIPFAYSGGEFYTYYLGPHSPTLSVEGDELHFKHQPGLGPYWVEYFAQKNP